MKYRIFYVYPSVVLKSFYQGHMQFVFLALDSNPADFSELKVQSAKCVKFTSTIQQKAFKRQHISIGRSTQLQLHQ